MPFGQLNQWKPLPERELEKNVSQALCQAIDWFTKEPCVFRIDKNSYNQCRECNILICNMHSRHRYMNYTICDRCHYELFIPYTRYGRIPRGVNAFNKTGILDNQYFKLIRVMNKSKACVFNCFRVAKRVANFLQTGDENFLTYKKFEMPMSDWVKKDMQDYYITYFRNRYGMNSVKTLNNLSVQAVEEMLRLHKTGSHAILLSNSGLNNYYNMEHAFNIIYINEHYKNQVIPMIKPIDGYRPDFYDFAFSGLKRYAEMYYQGATFNVILFPSQIDCYK